MIPRRARTWATMCSATILVACSGSAEFRSSFPDNRPDHLENLLQKLPASAAPSGPANDTGRGLVVVELDGSQSGVAAFDAQTGDELWRRLMPVDSTPSVGGPVVVVKSGQQIVGLSVRDGSDLWSRRAESIDYMGAAIDSGVVILTFSTAGQRASVFREAHAIAVDALSGRERWSLGPVEKQFGAPAAFGGVAFIPWDRLSLSVFDIASGQEIARLLSRDDVYSFVRAGPEGVFYGSTAAYRLSKQSVTGSREKAEVYEPLVANAPVSEGFYADGFLGQKGGRNARNKIRFLWRGAPRSGDEVSLADDTVYFLYYRILFSFDATNGAVRWVRTLESDVESAEVVQGGILLLGGDGTLLSIEASTGAIVHRTSLGVEVAGAVFDVHALLRGQPGDRPETSVREQLREVVFDPDARLTPARRFAVSVLASIPDEEATRDLLEVCRQRRVPLPVRHDAAMILRTRQSGSHYLVQALAEHHDFLANRESPPVGVIAAAVLHMRDETAIPRLWEHMLDPETPREDLLPIAALLTELGNESNVPQMRNFVVRYHADSEFNGAEDTLLELIRAIARHGSDEDREAMGNLAADSSTLSVFRRGLDEALEVPEPEEEAGEAGASEPAAETVTVQQLSQVMESSRAQIRPCLQSALRRTPELSEVRLNMVINGSGDLEELTVEPPDDILSSCMTLSLGQASFPRSMSRRRTARYTIRIEH